MKNFTSIIGHSKNGPGSYEQVFYDIVELQKRIGEVGSINGNEKPANETLINLTADYYDSFKDAFLESRFVEPSLDLKNRDFLVNTFINNLVNKNIVKLFLAV